MAKREKKDTPPLLTDQEVDDAILRIEQQGRRDVAWGMYMARARHSDYQTKGRELTQAVESANTKVEKDSAKRALEEYVAMARRNTTLFVGGT